MPASEAPANPMAQNKSIPTLTPLLLAGGKSTRMGEPKHLLRLQNGVLLYEHILCQICQALSLPPLAKIYISLHTDQAEPVAMESRSLEPYSIEAVYDEVGLEALPSSSAPATTPASSRQGPAGGICAAHRLAPNATFLVVACDFPMLIPETVTHLLNHYAKPVTSFRNREGFCEPLLGIWSPNALDHLSHNVRSGMHSPSQTIKQLKGRMLDPPPGCDHWLLNANTKSEWQHALDLLAAHR